MIMKGNDFRASDGWGDMYVYSRGGPQTALAP
jgi:hypothetical protein